jgi:uncharacterized membrane protein YoaK (UPF0700 family)
MFHHRIDRETPSSVIFLWFLLSFLAGDVNAGGLLACGRFVSHMTGFYTLFGEKAAHWTWDQALGLLSIPFYFLFGAMISAYFVERPVHHGKRPRYVIVMALAFLCLFLAAVLGGFGWFGEFGETHLRSTYFLLALLCMASGLQNAAVSSSSGHTVRVSHMTGNTTDLGIGIVRVWSLRGHSHRRDDEVRAAWLRAGIIGAFAFGSAIGAVLFIRYRYLGFLLPAALTLYATIREAKVYPDGGSFPGSK